jgi:hypothetical protein
LNEMHRNALSCIWVQFVKWNLQEGVPANIQLIQLVKWCFSCASIIFYGWLYGWFCHVPRVGVKTSVWLYGDSVLYSGLGKDMLHFFVS